MAYGLRNTTLWVESGGATTTLDRDFSVPAEWRGSVARDYGVPVEWFSSTVLLNRDFITPVEWFTILQRQFTAWVEWTATLDRDYGIPVEWYLGADRRFGIPVDWLLPTITLNRKFSAPTEWTGQVADTLLVVWDVRVPLEALLSVQWTVVNAGLVAQLPVVWTVRRASDPLIVVWSILPNIIPTFSAPVLTTPAQKPFGGVVETP